MELPLHERVAKAGEEINVIILEKHGLGITTETKAVLVNVPKKPVIETVEGILVPKE